MAEANLKEAEIRRATSAPVITMTNGMAKKLAPHGVRVNGVLPGVIDTPFHEQISTPEAMKNFTGIIPLGRVGTSDEVAWTVVYLASDAASFVIGENIEINGGMLMD
jgi:3-oxoacyl-[acyl-carrier protein] reductase